MAGGTAGGAAISGGHGMRLLRVFPRRTNATPTDELAIIGYPGLIRPEADHCHVSCAFTWDLPEAERMAEAWSRFLPTTLGGPGTGMRGEEFTPGMYLSEGHTITSRGCPNSCWFCDVWRREGPVRELPIRDGWIVNDDNLLACSSEHIAAVFAMLRRQPHRADLRGGLEAKRMTDRIAMMIAEIRPVQVWFAYDEEEDWQPLVDAVRMLRRHDARGGRWLRAYCLIGYPGDTIDAADKRLSECCALGVMPMAMLYRDARGAKDPIWARFQRGWVRGPAVGAKMCSLKEALHAPTP